LSEDFNQRIIAEFRANRGDVGGPFEHSRLLLLTTTGARSGTRHTVPLGYLVEEGGEARYVIASAGGADQHPAWYHNLLVHPEVTVEDGVFTFRAEAAVLQGEERERVFARAVEADPGWQTYQDRTTRLLPVVRLEGVDGGPDAASPGDALVAVHAAFRRELRLVRREVAATGTAGLGAQLRINCLNLCAGLEYHHNQEEQGMFPALAEYVPELAPVIARLRAEHERVAELVAELNRVVGEERAADRLLVEVDRLIGELEAHLDHEEEQLVGILNGAGA
jgi:deazaflavin-dependent oxidoreductase (nitroreductase family)